MNNLQTDRLLASDMEAERKQTRLAAMIGLPLGLSLSIGLPLTILHECALSAFLAINLVGPTATYFVQRQLKVSGHAMLAEICNYAGAGTGIVFAPFFGVSALPFINLASLYEDQGRFPLALKFMRFLDLPCKFSPLVPKHLAFAHEAGQMQMLFNAGRYTEAIKLSEKLVTSTNEVYQRSPSSKNQEAIWLVQSIIVGELCMTGRFEEGRAIWSKIKSLPDFGAEAVPDHIAYVYNNMAWGGAWVRDFESALRFGNLAEQTYQRGSNRSKLLEGNIRSNRAQALYGCGKKTEAESEAKLALEAWGTYLTPTAAQLAEAYSLLGRLANDKGDHETAVQNLELAISIHRERRNPVYPELTLALPAYADSLRAVGRSQEAQMIEKELDEIRLYHGMKEQVHEEQQSFFAESPASEGEQQEEVTGTPEELAKSATSKQTFPWVERAITLIFIAVLVSFISFEQTSLILFAIVAVFAAKQAATSLYGKYRCSILSKQLQKARCERVTISLCKTGFFPVVFEGLVSKGAAGLPAGTSLEFDIQSRQTPAAFHTKPVVGNVFFDPDKNKPLLVSVGKDAFSVNHGIGTKVHPKLRPVVGIASSIAMFGLVMLVALNGFTPPNKVPDGKTAHEYYELGVKYKTVGWTEQARESLQRAIKLGGSSADAKNAERYLNTKVPKYPVSQEAVTENIMGFNESSPVEAEKIWLGCIKKYPKFEWPYGNLGSQYVEQGRLKEGEALLQKALDINPSYVNAWLHLAECKRKQKDFEGAKKCLDTVMKLDPGNERAQVLRMIPNL